MSTCRLMRCCHFFPGWELGMWKRKAVYGRKAKKIKRAERVNTACTTDLPLLPKSIKKAFFLLLLRCSHYFSRFPEPSLGGVKERKEGGSSIVLARCFGVSEERKEGDQVSFLLVVSGCLRAGGLWDFFVFVSWGWRMKGEMGDQTRTPLLEKKEEVWWKKVLDVEEAKHQVFFSVPMILTNVSYYCITLISVMFAGHLGKLELASATLANSWATVTGLALMTGLSGALETLCGQGYGAKMYRMLGIYLQSSMITTFVFSVIVSIVWFYSDHILILLQQEPEVARMAGLYLKYMIPGLFAYGFLQCLLRFLQTQTVVIPLVICSVVPLIIEVGLTYLLVYKTSLGFKGAAISAAISLWVSFAMLALYVNYSKTFKYTWEGLSSECFKYVFPNMKLAIPSAVMVCLEYWAFELLVLLAGLMPNSENSTSLIAMCVNTEAVTFMITYGFAAAVSTRVSNELGAGNINQAKHAVAVTLKLSVLLALAVILSLAFGHNLWASSFSDSPVIKKDFAAMTPLLAVSILFDSAQGVLSGVSRGCGWQHLAAWTNLAAFYVIGMPIAVLLAFKFQLYAKGLWIGLICGLTCQACTLLVITLRTKWSKMALSVNDQKNHVLV